MDKLKLSYCSEADIDAFIEQLNDRCLVVTKEGGLYSKIDGVKIKLNGGGA